MNFLINDNEIIFKIRVTTNSTNPNANAERVSGELNSKSPTSAFTIVTVTVVISSSGFQERFGRRPAAITTTIVSPKAFDKARSDAEIIPFPSEEVTPPVTNTYFVEFDMNLNKCNYGAQS